MAIADSGGVDIIANNYADVIEGGQGYASGTFHPGVPAYGAEDDDEILTAIGTFQCIVGSSTSQIKSSTNYPSTYPGLSGRVNTDASDYEKVYPHFLVGAGAAEPNYNVVRRIISWGGPTILFGSLWPFTVTIGDSFKPMVGFRRAPDNADLEDLGAGAAWDRFFSLEIMPGRRDSWWGNNIEHYRTQLVVKVRFLKKARSRRVWKYALRQMLSLRAALCKPAARDANGIVQMVSAEDSEPEILAQDSDRMTVVDRLALVYRIDSTHR
jgi:hypothetical protein